jgi:3-keto-L-gulonate-6-phosphate decarboxylase
MDSNNQHNQTGTEKMNMGMHGGVEQPVRGQESYHKELSDMKFALDASSIVAITGGI